MGLKSKFLSTFEVNEGRRHSQRKKENWNRRVAMHLIIQVAVNTVVLLSARPNRYYK